MSANVLTDIVMQLYNAYGPRKPMGASNASKVDPHFFLVRSFLGEVDLAILFNTKRCRYQCRFCNLPAKSTTDFVGSDDIVTQFKGVLELAKHAIGVIERLTIANEGSVLDRETFAASALRCIVESTRVLPSLTRIVLETRLEFAEIGYLEELRTASGGKIIDVLTGFENADPYIRDILLGKRESLGTFLAGLERVASAGCALTAYVLYKPDNSMTDEDAFGDAERTIDFLVQHTRRLGTPLTIRLNPMYAARGTDWGRDALKSTKYKPPRLTDVLALAQKKDSEGVPVYLGLTSEGLADQTHTYRAREDFSKDLLRSAILWNRRKRLVSGVGKE